MDILISEDLQAPAIDRLAERFQIVRDPAIWKEPARLKATIAKARAVMVRNQTQLTAEVLASAPKLIGIGRVGVGLDNIDLRAASERGIVVIAPLGANAVSVAELAFGLMLALARKLPFADVSTKGGGWDRRGCTGMELFGKTLTICGFGRIGAMVAERARVFGMKVVAYDPFLKAEHQSDSWSEITFCENFHDALAEGDFVSVHTPLTAETKRFFNESAFAAMKRGAFFINTSRGGVVDEDALLHVLKTHHLGGAGLDVREVEPPVQPGPLALLDNVILLPHIGAFTHEAQTRTFEAVCRDLQRLLEGKPAVDFVNFPEPIAS